MTNLTDDSGPNFQTEKWCRRMPGKKKGKQKIYLFSIMNSFIICS